jgi:hypothetical protein
MFNRFLCTELSAQLSARAQFASPMRNARFDAYAYVIFSVNTEDDIYVW